MSEDLIVDAPGQQFMASGVYGNLGGLYEAWDAQKDLREQFRLVNRLLVEKPQEGAAIATTTAAIARTALNLRQNCAAVEPLCRKMSAASSCIPCIDALHKEVLKFHEAHGLNSSFKTIQDEAWSLRYMFGLVKQLTYKQSPPRDAQCSLAVFLFLLLGVGVIFYLLWFCLELTVMRSRVIRILCSSRCSKLLGWMCRTGDQLRNHLLLLRTAHLQPFMISDNSFR